MYVKRYSEMCGRFTQKYTSASANSSTGLQRLPHQRHYSRGQRPVTRADAVATGPEMVEEIAEGSPGDIQCEGGDGDGKTNVPRCIQTKLVSDPRIRLL